MVRTYILTRREREILKRFIETDEKLNGFAVLMHYLRRARDSLNEDLKLIDAALRKIEEHEA